MTRRRMGVVAVGVLLAVTGAAAADATVITFNDETAGGPAAQMDAVVGDWSVANLKEARGFQVDGTHWKQGTPSASLADQARRLYGDRYAEFLDGVKAFAFFPVAIYRGACPQDDVTLTVRFFPMAGRIDQAAGIAFNVQPDGSYLGVRANALEDNILFFKVAKGRRSIIQSIRNTPTASKTWHTLAVSLTGKRLTARLDGKQYLSTQLDGPASGRCGLWSKADSQVLFDDFTISPGAAP